jgi:hypothetical protein
MCCVRFKLNTKSREWGRPASIFTPPRPFYRRGRARAGSRKGWLIFSEPSPPPPPWLAWNFSQMPRGMTDVIGNVTMSRIRPRCLSLTETVLSGRSLLVALRLSTPSPGPSGPTENENGCQSHEKSRRVATCQQLPASNNSGLTS